MLTVHHLNNSRSQRVLWLLEELGVPYEIARYQRQSSMLAPPELRAIHPLGKSPVITDDGNTVAESGAIVEYIIGAHGNGRLIPPPNTPERLRYTYWLHYAEGSAMSPLLLKLLFTLMPKRAPALLRPLVRKVSNQALTTMVNPQLKQHMAYWETELGKSEWFAGNAFTSVTSRPSPRISPVGSTESPRRTITMRCDCRMTMRCPRSPDAKNASRGMPIATRALACA